MGYTIHYSFKKRATEEAARKAVTELRGMAMRRFLEVGSQFDIVGEDCDPENQEMDTILRWNLIQVSIGRKAFPTRVFGFTAVPGEGCESASFGLCRFENPRENRALTVHEWSWQAFCKTDFSGEKIFGGSANFVRSHSLVVGLLDKIKELGFHVMVEDETGYWKHRDVSRLAKLK